MYTRNYTTMLPNMEDVAPRNTQEDKQEITIELEMQQKEQMCPKCKAATSRVHD